MVVVVVEGEKKRIGAKEEFVGPGLMDGGRHNCLVVGRGGSRVLVRKGAVAEKRKSGSGARVGQSLGLVRTARGDIVGKLIIGLGVEVRPPA